MKKNILVSFNLLFVLFLYSCSSEQPTEVVESPSSSIDAALIAPIVKSGSFKIGPYGGLGYGYNITGEYANANSSGLQVIDFEKFAKDHPARLVEEFPYSTQYSTISAEDASAFSNLISGKLDITTDLNMFGKMLSSNFSSTMTNNNKFDPKYIYGKATFTIEYNRFRVNSSTDVLKNYLTPEFLQSLDSKTPQQIVNDYGTHVMLDIYIGARLDAYYQSETTDQDREQASAEGIESAMNAVFNAASINDNATLARKNFSQRLSFRTIGGDPSASLNGYLNLDLDQSKSKVSIANWQKTTNFNNSYLVDIDSNGLIYIYDLVSDPTKKAALKAYVDQYIIDNKVTLN